MKNRYIVTFAIILFTCFTSFSFAQSKKELKEFKRIRDKYLFNVKLKNKQIFENINFKLHKDFVIVPVVINGKTYNFVFDTGAMTLFSDSLAKKLNATSSFPVPTIDAGGITKTIDYYRTDNVQIGSLCFDNVGYGVANLDVFQKHLCMRIDGLLGVNIFNLLNWEIDFSNQIISVSNKPFSVNNYSMEIPFIESLGGRTPEIRMIMGKYNFYAKLDMGNNDLIQIPDSIFFTHRESSYLKYVKGKGEDTKTIFNDETPQNLYIAEIDSFYIVSIRKVSNLLIINAYLSKNKVESDFTFTTTNKSVI